MMPILMLGYILTHPIQALKLIFSGNELTQVEEINAMSPQYNEGGDYRVNPSLIGSAFVYYNQNDPRWKDINYASNTVGISGCGPVSGAMVLSALLESAVLPSTVAGWCESNGYMIDSGTQNGFAYTLAAHYGLVPYYIGDSDRAGLVDALTKGHYVIALMGDGTFTGTTHYIVLRGISGSRVYVADPNSVSKSNTMYPIDTVLAETKGNFTAISPPPPPPR